MLLTKFDQKNEENWPNSFTFRCKSGYFMWILWMLTKIRLFVVLKNVFAFKPHWKMKKYWFYLLFIENDKKN